MLRVVTSGRIAGDFTSFVTFSCFIITMYCFHNQQRTLFQEEKKNKQTMNTLKERTEIRDFIIVSKVDFHSLHSFLGRNSSHFIVCHCLIILFVDMWRKLFQRLEINIFSLNH